MTKARGIGRGGKRAGAGRKPTGQPRKVIISITLSPELAAWVKERGATRVITEALEQYQYHEAFSK